MPRMFDHVGFLIFSPEYGELTMDTSNQKQPSPRTKAPPPGTTSALPPTSRPEPSPSARGRPWLKNVPFLGLHLGCLAVFFVSPDWPSLILFVVLYFVRMFGITAGYHRYFSHRSYKTSRWFQFVLACLGCCAMQKGPLWWAAHHRQHHRHTDTPEDPHSPLVRSFWWSHIGWILNGDSDETNWSAIRDWSRYPELRWLNRLQWVPGMVLAGLCWLLAGWSGLIWGFLLSTILLFHATFAVNSFCHLWGSRRYATPDASRNNLWVALLTLGEGWHNNHHHYQSAANQGFFWWEIDVSYYLIKLLGFTGLVWAIRKPTRRIVEAAAE
jgi:stearoyl-CoA desaturase (Delta-9 desaturase)